MISLLLSQCKNLIILDGSTDQESFCSFLLSTPPPPPPLPSPKKRNNAKVDKPSMKFNSTPNASMQHGHYFQINAPTLLLPLLSQRIFQAPGQDQQNGKTTVLITTIFLQDEMQGYILPYSYRPLSLPRILI